MRSPAAALRADRSAPSTPPAFAPAGCPDARQIVSTISVQRGPVWRCRLTRPARHADRQPRIAAAAQQSPLRQPAAQCPMHAAFGSGWSCMPKRRSGWSLCSGGHADRRRGVRAAEAPSETAPTTPQGGGYLSDIIAFEVQRVLLRVTDIRMPTF